MTFKHVKFQDSPTMRALEKVAQEKGLVKPEVMQKQASIAKKADVSPTSSLMENIFKLCAGMREQGLVKEAAEIEINFLNYKRAQTLYEAHKEKGEDLIHAAHPDGSHKLEGVEGDEATFEDILDKHTLIIQKVEKKPTGKLSSATQILNSVKTVLGQAADGLGDIKGLANQAAKKIDTVVNMANDELTFSVSGFGSDIRSKLSNPSVYNLNSAKDKINALHHRLDPSVIGGVGFGFSGVSNYTWARLQPLMNEAVSLINDAIGKRKEYDSGEQSKLEGSPAPAAPAAPAGGDFSKKILGVAAQYSALSNQISSDDPKDADALAKTKTWLQNKSQALQALASQFEGETDKASVTSVYQSTLNKYIAALKTVQGRWP